MNIIWTFIPRDFLNRLIFEDLGSSILNLFICCLTFDLLIKLYSFFYGHFVNFLCEKCIAIHKYMNIMFKFFVVYSFLDILQIF